MKPSVISLSEIVVNDKQPKWINKILLRVLKNKKNIYQTTEKTLSYNYETYTLTDSTGYAFTSKGNIVFPKMNGKTQFKIDAQNNIIKCKDKTAGTDFLNLRRMLYDDFIQVFDNKFIRNNTFSVNSSFKSEDSNLIQLIFTSKKFSDYDGYLVIDTANNVIMEAERNSGTDFNIKTQTSVMLRNVASAMGFNYKTWITKNNTKYKKIGQSYYMNECKYKFYMKTKTKNKKVDSNYFTSSESKLIFDNKTVATSKRFIKLPKPYYIVKIITKKMKLEEEALNKVKVKHEKF